MPQSNVPIGKVCPACYTIYHTSCEYNYAMQCTGEENSCLILQAYQEDLSSGCSTRNFCGGFDALRLKYLTYDIHDIDCIVNEDKTSLPVVNRFLFCYECQNPKYEHCYPNLCKPEYDTCLSELTVSITGIKRKKELTYRCGYSSECKRTGIMRSNGKILFLSTSCCDEDSCIPPQRTIPSSISREPNGLTCPSCYIGNSARCLGRDVIQCVGNESHCISYAKTTLQEYSASVETMFGCSSKEICEAGSSRVYSEMFDQTIMINVICSSATIVCIQAHSLLILSFMLYSFIKLSSLL
ncbi:phospholipase A2 inhibitor subunit gamma B-like [Xenopus laevis]|uniref:Phospholipase A2 inhibitor subunit gamma B-like n=1 Tax=Xenopus laevis TaxID=8355 RepID=A0A8J1LF10_XENLA|nr:phospholipase A2 inhibitor subunit gamma B-like [Xenopus laevis]